MCERRLQYKFQQLKMEVHNINRHIHNSYSDIIYKATLHKNKVVWNVSGIDIPIETEELLRKPGINFQFAPRKFPSL